MRAIHHIYADLIGMFVSLGMWSDGLVHDENMVIRDFIFKVRNRILGIACCSRAEAFFFHASEEYTFSPFSLTPHKVACDSLDTCGPLIFPSPDSARNEYRVRLKIRGEEYHVLPA